MAKLVEELRNARIMGVEEMCWQAADEIERLRAEREQQAQRYREQFDAVLQLNIDNEKLRARVAAAHSIISDLVGVFDEWPEHEVRKAREGYGYEPMPNRLRAWLADGDATNGSGDA